MTRHVIIYGSKSISHGEIHFNVTTGTVHLDVNAVHPDPEIDARLRAKLRKAIRKAEPRSMRSGRLQKVSVKSHKLVLEIL